MLVCGRRRMVESAEPQKVTLQRILLLIVRSTTAVCKMHMGNVICAAMVLIKQSKVRVLALRSNLRRVGSKRAYRPCAACSEA